MILKYHAEVPNIKEAIPYYETLFNGTVVKNGFGQHGYVKLFDQIGLTIFQNEREVEKVGELVIKFEGEEESKLMDELMERVNGDDRHHINYPLRYFPWGTELFSFKDIFGYSWTLER